jgi:cyclophilin family peptidyl-prolyl cis-trans isomerase
VIALRDEDPNVRIEAARALDSTLVGAPRGDWVHAYGQDTSFAFHAVVLQAAVRNGVILPELDHDNADRWQRSGDWRFRAAAAMAGSGSSMERIVDMTLPLTRDPDPRVRAAAYEVFAEAAGQSTGGTPHPWRRDYMLTAVHDPDIAVRAVGLAGLAEIATAADVPLVADAYQAAVADTGNDARLMAVRCLVAIWKSDSAHVTDDAKAKVAALPVTDDAALLDAARGVTLLAAWRPENGRPAPHPADWYLRVVHEIVEPTLRGQAPQATIQTAKGNITIELYGADAPLTVDNFLTLAKRGFYKNTSFHRVVPSFVVQDGDPRGDGRGGPGYDIRDELGRRRYVRGTVGMALDGPNTGGSQYFIRRALHGICAGHIGRRGARSDRAVGYHRQHRAACARRYSVRVGFVGCTLALVATACAPPMAGELKGIAPVAPTRVPAAVLPPSHGKLTFKWEYRDRDMLARGEGRALVAPPDSARLDFAVAGGMGSGRAWLFGDTVVSGGGGERIKRYLPSPVVLWAALGRFAVPGADTTVRMDGDTLRADVRGTDATKGGPSVWRVAFADAKLVGLERLVAGRVRETVVRRKNGDIKFDNPAGARSLTLTHVRSDTVAEIDPELWHR